MTAKAHKDQLLDFIDHKAFDVILAASPKTYDSEDKEKLEELQKKTEKEKKKFHGYNSAKEIKENFMENIHSKPAKKLNKDLEDFKLPTLPKLKDEFIDLCEKLDV